MKKVMKNIFWKLMLNINLEQLHELHNDLTYLSERMKIEKSKSLQLIYMIKLNILSYTHKKFKTSFK